MPDNRDSIPAETERLVRTRAGHRCSVDGETCALEIAHIVEYSKSQSHSPENLLLMCALCHTRSHVEKWDRKTLRYYRDHPFVTRDKGFPRLIQNLRYSTLGQDFVGREDTLALLNESLSGGRATALKGHVIHGLGGVGKTRTAIEYAWRFQSQYKALLLVDADSPASLSRSLAALCGERILDLPEVNCPDQTVQETAVLRWLQSHDDWLLIIDNADTDDSLAAADSLLPSLVRGHVLLTSRLTNLTGSFTEFSLDVLGESAATSYLLQRTKGRRTSGADDAERAAEISHLLDGLALALEQAAAYIQKSRISFAEYLTFWHSHTAEAIKWHDGKKMHYPRSLAVTYDTSVSQLSDDAKQLLKILSWFGPDPIPFAIFDTKIVSSETRVQLAELENLSLAKRRDDQLAFTIHRLVQEITRQQQIPEKSPEALKLGLKWFSLSWEFDSQKPADETLVRTLAPHAEHLGQFGIQYDIHEPTSEILNNVGAWLLHKAVHLSAESVFKKAIDLEVRHTGESKDLVRMLNNFAIVLSDLGKYTEAENAYLRSLDIITRNSNGDTRDEAWVLRHLATLHFRTNRFAEAEAEFKKALAVFESRSDQNQRLRAMLLNDLGELMLKTNRLNEAEAMIREGVELIDRSEDATLMAGGLNNLAQVMEATGRDSEAEELYKRSLSLCEKELGRDHPVVAVRLNNLANIFNLKGRWNEAEVLLRRALAIDRATFGENHVEVAMDLMNLGALLQKMTQFAEAESALRRSLRIWESIFSFNHPEAAICYNNLGCTLQSQGKTLEAEDLYLRAKSIHEATLGEDHPAVSLDLSNLAEVYRSTDRLEEANIAMRHSIRILVRASIKNRQISKDLNRRVNEYGGLLEQMALSHEAIRKKINKLIRPLGHVWEFHGAGQE